jgi:hypothetical protein
VSQILSDAALDEAVASFTRQLGEQEVTRASELFGEMIDCDVARAEPLDTSKGTMATANGERIVQTEVESQHHSSPATVEPPTFIQGKSVPPDSKDQQVSDAPGCNLEIDLSVVLNDLDSNEFISVPVAEKVVTGGESETQIQLPVSAVIKPAENVHSISMESVAPNPATDPENQLIERNTAEAMAEGKVARHASQKHDAEKQSFNDNHATQKMVKKQLTASTSKSCTDSSVRESVPKITTSNEKADVPHQARSSQRNRRTSMPSAAMKATALKPMVSVKRTNCERSPIRTPRQFGNHPAPRRPERDERRAPLSRPSTTPQSRSRSPNRRPSESGGVFVSRAEYDEFLRWNRNAKK